MTRFRGIPLLLALSLVVGACGSTATPTPPPSTTPDQSTSGQATSGQPTSQVTDGPPASAHPPASDEPPATIGPIVTADPNATPAPTVPPAPLPGAELFDANEIAAYLGTGGTGIQAVVSMLAYLGIGIYRADGTPVTTGSERGAQDLFVYEDEVRELDRMATYKDAEAIAWSDFHSSLVQFGVTMSAEELLAAYQSAYADNPEARISQLITALGGPSADFQMTPLMAWLLFVDGFYAPSGEAGGIARRTAARVAGGAEPGWGVAAPSVRPPSLIIDPFASDPRDFPLVIAHLMMLSSSTVVYVTPPTGDVHEGHGGPGLPEQFEASVYLPLSTTWVSPFTGDTLLPLGQFGGALVNMPVTWRFSSAWLEHGTFEPSPGGAPPLQGNEIASTIGPDGKGSIITFAPRTEVADGEGHFAEDGANLRAEVLSADLLETIYGAANGTMRGLMGRRSTSGNAYVDLEWHAARTMHVVLTSEYDVTIDYFGLLTGHRTGTDTFEGDLVQLEDESWRGVLTGRSNASEEIVVFDKPCNTNWSGEQQLQVTATAGEFQRGTHIFEFVPAGPPIYTNTPGCYEEAKDRDGMDYLQFNDAGITDSVTPGVVLDIAEAPGGTTVIRADLPDVLTSSWTATVEYHEPDE